MKIPISDEKAKRIEASQAVLEFQSVSGVSGKKSRCKTGAREAGLFTRSFVPRFLLAASQDIPGPDSLRSCKFLVSDMNFIIHNSHPDSHVLTGKCMF